MSDEEKQNISEGDDKHTEAINNSLEIPKPAAVKIRHYRVPLIIAACIFLATVIFFCSWKCFFDTSIEGTWGIDINISDSDDVNYNFTFDNDNMVRYQAGGQAAIGRYYFSSSEGKDIITVYLSSGSEQLTASFNYAFEGNVFTGRTLKLTDLSGFFFAPDTDASDESEVKAKKKITDSITEDGITYYCWNFTPSSEKFKVDKPKNFKADKELIGTWLYMADEEGYSYTFTFNDDGTFEQRNYQSEVHGKYTVSDGVCSVSYYSLGNVEMEGDLNYSVDGNKLTLGSQEFEKTNDKYAYQSEIK